MQAVLGMAQSTTSKHLQILEDAGLIISSKEGRWVNYRIDEDSYNPYAGPIMDHLRFVLDDDPQVKADLQKAARANRFELCSK